MSSSTPLPLPPSSSLRPFFPDPYYSSLSPFSIERTHSGENIIVSLALLQIVNYTCFSSTTRYLLRIKPCILSEAMTLFANRKDNILFNYNDTVPMQIFSLSTDSMLTLDDGGGVIAQFVNTCFNMLVFAQSVIL